MQLENLIASNSSVALIPNRSQISVLNLRMVDPYYIPMYPDISWTKCIGTSSIPLLMVYPNKWHPQRVEFDNIQSNDVLFAAKCWYWIEILVCQCGGTFVFEAALTADTTHPEHMHHIFEVEKHWVIGRLFHGNSQLWIYLSVQFVWNLIWDTFYHYFHPTIFQSV